MRRTKVSGSKIGTVWSDNASFSLEDKVHPKLFLWSISPLSRRSVNKVWSRVQIWEIILHFSIIYRHYVVLEKSLALLHNHQESAIPEKNDHIFEKIKIKYT